MSFREDCSGAFSHRLGFSKLQADLLGSFSANLESLANLAVGFDIFLGFNDFNANEIWYISWFYHLKSCLNSLNPHNYLGKFETELLTQPRDMNFIAHLATSWMNMYFLKNTHLFSCVPFFIYYWIKILCYFRAHLVQLILRDFNFKFLKTLRFSGHGYFLHPLYGGNPMPGPSRGGCYI